MSDFIRIPPDSTGKRIRHGKHLDLSLLTLNIDASTLKIGDVILDDTSGSFGYFSGWGIEQDGSHDIFLVNANGNFTVGGTISSVDHGTIGTVFESIEIHTNKQILVDSDNPYNTQKIDGNGASYVRFREGDALLDAFGYLETTTPFIADTHTFYHGINLLNYTITTASSGSVTTAITDSSLLLSTNTTNGSLARLMTNQYYPYIAGSGLGTQMSILIGDNGKSGVVRRWGLFDDLDGVFFQLSGTTFQVGIRNSSSGSVVENVVNQENFNGDSLIDFVNGEFVLDITKYNLYWIDYQWLGVGKVRFGVFSPNGTRVTLHTFKNPNANIVPYMRQGTLPLRMEQYNTTSVVSSSEFRLVCANIVYQGGDINFKGDVYDFVSNRLTISGNTLTPIITGKILDTLYGRVNNGMVFSQSLEVNVEGDDVILEYILNPYLENSVYTTNNYGSFTELDSSSTFISGGTRILSFMFTNGNTLRTFKENDLRGSLKNLPNGFVNTFAIAAKTIKPNGLANIKIIYSWKEVS